MKNRIISILSLFAITASFIPSVYAAGASGEVGTISWELSGETLTISGSGTVPAEFISDNEIMRYRKDITELVVNDGITAIGEDAFANSSLEKVTLAESVKTIGGYTFYKCSYLESVTMPGVVVIGEYAFNNTVLDEDYTILPDCLEEIGECAFYNTSFTAFDIPASVTSIGYRALASRNVSRISVDENNQNYSSENYILFNKDKTELLYYPAKRRLKSWDRETTPEYEPDTYIIPDTVENIDYYAFYRSQYLGEVVFPASLGFVGEYVFIDSSVTNIDTSENDYFVYEDGILYDTPKTVVYSGLIKVCKGKIELPGTVYEIYSGAFEGFSDITEIVLPESLWIIGSAAFYGCGISELTLPKNMAYIRKYAFADCEKLETVTMYHGIREIENAFRYDDISKVTFYGTENAWEWIADSDAVLAKAEVEYLDYDDSPLIYAYWFYPGLSMAQVCFYTGDVPAGNTAVAVLYGADGEILGVKTFKTEDNGKLTYANFEDIHTSVYSLAEVYFWDSLTGMKPVGDVMRD